MSQINTTQLPPTSFTLAQPGGATPFQYLTPDALMLYCQTRLRGIDTQVEAAFAQQESGNADSTALSTLSANLTVPSGDLDLNTPAGYQQAYDTAQQMIATANTLQDPQTKQSLLAAAATIQGQLTTAYNNMTGNNSFKPPFTSDQDIQNFFKGTYVDGNGNAITKQSNASVTISTASYQSEVTDAVKSIQSDLNSNTELAMINLQSLMSQRQEAIQVCTNLVQSMGDSTSQVTANVGK
jgi:hypothetical protein